MSMTFLFDHRRAWGFVVAAMSLGCQPDLRHQDRPRSQAYSDVFPDRREARLPVSGTVARQRADGDGREEITDYLPRPFSREQLDRGEKGYQVFCVPCHGYTGAGDGMVIQHGFPKPTSFHELRLLAANDAHFYAVISEGAGAMPSYRKQISVSERWAIVAYLRALQLSQNVVACDLPPEVKRQLRVGDCSPRTKSAR